MPLVIGNTTIQSLTLDALLLHVAIHALHNAGSFKLLHLCDMAWLVSRFGHQYDPAQLSELAQAWKSRIYLNHALQAIEEILDLPIGHNLRAIPTAAPWLRSGFRAMAKANALIDTMEPKSRSHKIAREFGWELALGRLPIHTLRQRVFRHAETLMSLGPRRY